MRHINKSDAQCKVRLKFFGEDGNAAASDKFPAGYTIGWFIYADGFDSSFFELAAGFENGIDGFSLAEKMQKQAERFGVRSEYAEVLRMDLTAVPKLLETCLLYTSDRNGDQKTKRGVCSLSTGENFQRHEKGV